MFPYWYPRADTNGVSYGPWSLAILNLQAQAIANFLGQLQVARETGSSLQCSAYYFQFHLLKSAGIGPLSRAIHMVVGFIRSTFILRERCVVTPQGRSDSQCRLDYKKLSTQHGLFHICYSIRYSLSVIELNEIYIHDTKKGQKGKDPNRTLRPMMGAHTRDIQWMGAGKGEGEGEGEEGLKKTRTLWF